MNKYILTLTLIASMCISSYGQQQEVFGAAGTEVENATHHISYTIGEMVIETAQTEDNQVTQGYHQSSLVITGIGEPSAGLNVSVYPNPTSDMLIIESAHLDEVNTVWLYDMAGAVVKSVRNDQTHQLTIDLKTISVGTYLMVAETDKKDQALTYQIIKTH